MSKLSKPEATEAGIGCTDREKYVVIEHTKCNFEKPLPKRLLERKEFGKLVFKQNIK